VDTGESLAIAFGRIVCRTRLALRRTQKAVGASSGLSQSEISRIEHGRRPGLSLRTIGALCDALGIQAAWALQPPFVAGASTPEASGPIRRPGRQQDAGHARCSAFVRRRLERLAWEVAQEVEIVLGRTHGWIDILAFHAATGTLLIGEIKTELHDIGELQRTLAWYQREASSAARRLGWTPRRAQVCLFVLSTDENDVRVGANRELLAQVFPVRSGGWDGGSRIHRPRAVGREH
jgi:transcriptional regulator with XRE-family HTH domain